MSDDRTGNPRTDVRRSVFGHVLPKITFLRAEYRPSLETLHGTSREPRETQTLYWCPRLIVLAFGEVER
jgi:hypothetical protein